MKSKLWLLTKNSLDKKIKSKWFVVINIVIAILIIGLINIDNIIKTFGGDFNEKNEILVIDETNILYDYLELNFNNVKESSMGSITYEIKKYEGTEKEAKKIIEENNDLLVLIKEDSKNIARTSIISYNIAEDLITQVLLSSINNAKMRYAMESTTLDKSELAKIYTDVEFVLQTLSDERDLDSSMSMVMSTVFPIIILPFFMLAIFAVQFIGTEINEEKTSKGMEIILTNVSAKTHLFSKVISNNLFVIIQGAILLLSLIAGLIIRVLSTGNNLLTDIETYLGPTFDAIKSTGFIDSLPILIPLVLILMLLTFIAFSLLSGVLASMTTSMEDFQQMQMPTMLILMFSYYISMMAGMFDGSLFIKIIGYIPFVSAILAPALLILGQFSVIDMLISITITIGAIVILYHYGLKIYKVGILNYSSDNLFKKIITAVKS